MMSKVWKSLVVFSQSYVPDQLSLDEVKYLFVKLANTVGDMVTDVANDKFSSSIFDTEFPKLVAARLNTRDMINRKSRTVVQQPIRLAGTLNGIGKCVGRTPTVVC